eukprot:CAMPEP_0184031336 /NCGR_PEP_ID=MMETSP0955-20130417/2174_1 /TAXON_ID=627963 /ORGANISM="Aplanochytrium sp, Strain PBS07" /LENGTH=198 /DNA_ID=CAMNT_0026317057 /DNA_START=239 /DNA_END=835 /DNA_ORIENTATION=+
MATQKRPFPFYSNNSSLDYRSNFSTNNTSQNFLKKRRVDEDLIIHSPRTFETGIIDTYSDRPTNKRKIIEDVAERTSELICHRPCKKGKSDLSPVFGRDKGADAQLPILHSASNSTEYTGSSCTALVPVKQYQVVPWAQKIEHNDPLQSMRKDRADVSRMPQDRTEAPQDTQIIVWQPPEQVFMDSLRRQDSDTMSIS